MNDRKQQAKSIFMNALELEAESERSDFLRDQCGDDHELRQEVDQLLQHCDQIDGFLDAPVLQATEDGTSDMLGQQIGPYKLLQQIGEGGFGVVYMAEQLEPVRRKVALKLVKPGMDSKQVIARFESERQALALMDHPNIAKAHDAGVTDDGRPYFVMELIHGRRITEFCDENQLTPRQRLELFIPVCRAIQHAHQRGIIHRDIKPSNVLVSLYDGEPVPKVIDFGVAKAVGQQLTEKTMFTQFGQVIGTPDYMSPEQATLNQLEVDTRSDIYGLGAVLYELLAGVPPFESTRIRSAAFDEMLRIIREEDPQRPSRRLSTEADSGTISKQRGTEPTQLARALHGDLDWIVMKALDKKRDRRYETANSFADDIRRFLDNDVVRARPPSTMYQVQKFVSRNRGFVVATALLLTSLCVGLIGTSIGFLSAREQSQLADAESEKAKAAQASAERSAKENRQLAFTSRMQLAKELWRQPGTHRQVNELVTGLIPLGEEPDLRDFAWRYQWTQLHQSARLTKTETHRAAVSAGGRLVTGDATGIHEWDDSGELFAKRWTGDARKAWFGPRGKWVAVPEKENILLIDLSAGTVVGKLPGERCGFSADGMLLAVWKIEEAVELWSLTEEAPTSVGQLPGVAIGRNWDIFRFTPDGKSSLKWWTETRNVAVTAYIEGRDPLEWKHGSPVGSTAISPDGKWMAVGTYTGEVYLRKISDPEQAVQVATHGKHIHSICFSPDSTIMATGGGDGTIDFWRTEESGAKLDRSFNAHLEQSPITGINRYGIHSLAFSPDKTRLASWDSAGVAKLWMLDSLDDTYNIDDFAEDLYGADFGIEFKYGEVVQLPSGFATKREPKALAPGITESNAAPTRPAASAVGSQQDVGGSAIQIGDIVVGISDSEQGPRIELADKDEVDFEKLVSSGPMGSTAFLHLERGDEGSEERKVIELTRTNKTSASPHRVAFSPDGASLAIADGSHGATLWSVADMTARRLPMRGVSAAFTPDGHFLVMDDLKELVIWDLDNDRVDARLDLGFKQPTNPKQLGASIAISPNGQFLAAGTGPPFDQNATSSQLHIWDLPTRRKVRTPIECSRVFLAVAFTPDNKSLVAVDHDGVLRVWNTDDWEAEPREWRVGRPASMCLSPDGKTIAIGRWDGRTVSLWDLITAETIRVLGEHFALGLAFSPDGKTLVSAGYDHKIQVWDLAKSLRSRSLAGHTDYIAGVAFSPDGTVLATAGNEGTLRLWRAEHLAKIDRHPATLKSMFQLGQSQNRLRQFDKANARLRRTLELQQTSLPGNHKDIATTRSGILYAMRGSNRQPVVARPISLKVTPGKVAEFTAEVEGEGPWSYQWFHNNQPIPGATESGFGISKVSDGDYGRYFVRVRPLGDNQTIATQSETAFLVSPNTKQLVRGLQWETFSEINGRLVSSLASQLPFRHQADATEVVDSFEIPSNTGNHFGGRLSGLIVPPETGEYVFYLCSDDTSELFLSSDDLPNESKLVAKVTTRFGPREWETLPAESISQPIRLEAGKRYWTRVLFKENWGPDHLAVTWQLQGEAPPKNDDSPILGEFLRHRP